MSPVRRVVCVALWRKGCPEESRAQPRRRHPSIGDSSACLLGREDHGGRRNKESVLTPLHQENPS